MFLKPVNIWKGLGTNLRSLSSSSGDRKGFWERTFGLESNTASSHTNRWRMFVPAFSTHVCLGAPYGWSAIRFVFSQSHNPINSRNDVSGQLTREKGLVVSAAPPKAAHRDRL